MQLAHRRSGSLPSYRLKQLHHLPRRFFIGRDAHVGSVIPQNLSIRGGHAMHKVRRQAIPSLGKLLYAATCS